MSVLQNNSSGNFTVGATWSLVDATSFLNSETGATATTVAFVGSSSFITGAITIDGIAVKVSARSVAPTGTFSVRLFNVTGAIVVVGTTVTINVADIPNASPNGWIFMKFSAPVLLALAPTAYRVEVTSSTAGQVTLYRDATAGNWSRLLRTTTTQAPVATDDLIVCGDFISAGVNNSYTVTMDNTTTTIFGSNVSPTVANGFNSGISISAKGTLNWGTTGATNYYLKLAGNITLYANGIYQCGTIGTPMPSTSTAKLEFACTSNVQFGFEARINSTVIMYGNPITNVSAILSANAIIGATSLTTNISTGWKSGDVIALASTTRTAAAAESKVLTADAVGTTLTITALTNAHGGVSPVQAELINLTRNVQIFGTTTAFQSYINIQDATIDIQYVEFFQLGSATASKRGIDIATILNTGMIKYCSIHDYIVASSLGVNFNSGTLNNFTLDTCVFYNTQSTAINASTTSNSNWTVQNIIAIRCVGAVALISFARLNGTISNITATSGAGVGIQFADTSALNVSYSTFIAHSNASSGISIVNVSSLSSSPITFSNIISWRNNVNGLIWTNSFNVLVNTATIFGNLTAGINGGSHYASCRMINFTVNAGVTLTQPIGYAISVDSNIIVEDSTFGATTTHATADVSVTAGNTYCDTVFRNCLFSSPSQFINTTINIVGNSAIGVQKFQQTAGNHKTFKRFGIISVDTVIFNGSSPSVRITPNSAIQKVNTIPKNLATPNGQTATINVSVRKSVIGDGVAYNGNQPRLILLEDAAMGILADTVLATATNSANGAFMQLTGVTPPITDNGVFRVYVDCDGTAGFVNVDSWSVS
jgi:hypothetical protein